MIFRCKNCGGNVVYDPNVKQMHCPHCNSVLSEEQVNATVMETCMSCGAPMQYTDHTSATKCPNCGTYAIFEERVSGKFEPELIIPFCVSRDRAKEILKKEFGKRVFTPDGFLSNSSLEKMEGTYVPFFMYDYHNDINYQATGVKVRHWSDSRYAYTETSYYDVVREMTADFDKVPVDASIAMEDGIMDLMEPYDYNELEKHQNKFLSGFYSEKYNMGERELTPRAEAKVRSDSDALLRSTLTGYTSFQSERKNMSLKKNEVYYALLPVWEYVYSYHGVAYRFHVNGQTGKVVGKTPVSKARVFGYGVTVFGIIMAIGFALRMALLAL